jgi:tetratricopeptide (TPR) repeat protein
MLGASLVVLSLLVPAPNRPIEEVGWVGKLILIKLTGINLDPSEEPREPLPEGSGLPANAIQYRVVAERPNHVQVRSRQGTSGWLRKDDVVLLDDAVAFFTERLNANPNNMDALSRRGSAWRSKGDYEAALKDATEAIRLNQHSALYNNRAIIYNAMKDYDRALADYAQALSINPQYSLVYVNRAMMWHGRKEYDKAISDTTQALQFEPRYPGAFRVRGVAWHAQKDYDKAIADLDEAVKLDPGSAHPRTDRGQTLAARKEMDKAHADFIEALRLEPYNPSTIIPIAMWLASSPDAKHRDGELALRLARRAHQEELSSVKAIEALAAAYAELGRFAEAIRWQERALQDASLKSDDDAARRLELYRKKRAYRQE